MAPVGWALLTSRVGFTGSSSVGLTGPTTTSRVVCTVPSKVGLTVPNNNNNNSNFFCANILENQAQWRDKTRGLINLIIESNA